MRVAITAGAHDPPGHFMVVDGHGFLLDLSKVEGTLVDPVIREVTWGLVLDGATLRDGGTIIRRDGSQQRFYDAALLEPYLDAWRTHRAELPAADAR